MQESGKRSEQRRGDAPMSARLVQLRAQGLDVLAQAEAFLRYAREIHRNVMLLKDEGSTAPDTEAMHVIRTVGSKLLRECGAFCETVSELQTLVERETPEQRVRSQAVAEDRRRRHL